MLKLFNTLTRQKEEFKPITDKQAGVYTCGPTVYDYAHIGNLRAYIFADVLKRALLHNGFAVKHIMNITDVGHLTGDRDMGEDKLQAASARERKTAWEIASFYTEAFLADIKKLNIILPDKLPKATDHVKDMIKLVEALEKKGFTYRTSDGIYFDTSKLADYGKLARLDIEGLKEGARVEINTEKKNATDFAVWKFSSPSPNPSPQLRRNVASQGRGIKTVSSPLRGEEKGGGESKRQMEWQSPWGVGFPGWHIECSAMSVKYLDQPFDIHTGGIDHISVHHTNEIAQSEAAYDKPLANFWLHNDYLLIDEARAAKSAKNFFTLEQVTDKSYSPLAYRYLVLQAHYRSKMNFSWEAMDSAQNSLNNLYAAIASAKQPKVGCAEFESQFFEAMNDDLDMPKALSVMWDMMRSDYPAEAKLQSLLEFDKVLGLNVRETWEELKKPLPEAVAELARARQQLRSEKNWQQADEIRKQIEKQGFDVSDTGSGQVVKRKV